ncbi:MAG TPA: GNAT family protein [Bacteroidia bacterium]
MRFDHFLIRIIQQNDAEAYFNLVNNNLDRLADFFAGTVAANRNQTDSIQFIQNNLQKFEDQTYMPFVIVDMHSNELIGYIDVKNIDWKIPKAELGCFIDQSHAGKGISSKAMNLVIDHLFNEKQFIKLFLRTHESNTAARHLAEASGFELEGKIRCDYKTTSGKLADLLYYGLINPSYVRNQIV